jgi:hypothetical protein
VIINIITLISLSVIERLSQFWALKDVNTGNEIDAIELSAKSN